MYRVVGVMDESYDQLMVNTDGFDMRLTLKEMGIRVAICNRETKDLHSSERPGSL